jgi:hypothetical protein
MSTRRKSKVQSILFDRDYFTLQQAKRWLKRYCYKYGKVHTTKRFYRFRQFEPNYNKYHRTIKFKEGIKAIIEFPV